MFYDSSWRCHGNKTLTQTMVTFLVSRPAMADVWVRKKERRRKKTNNTCTLIETTVHWNIVLSEITASFL